MADSIGNQGFIALKGGYPIPRGETPVEITRPGVNGVAYREGVRRGETFKLFGIVDTTTAINATQTSTGYQNIKGQIVSLSLSGITFSNYIILDVVTTRVHRTVNSVGGLNGGNWLVESEWTLRYAGA